MEVIVIAIFIFIALLFAKHIKESASLQQPQIKEEYPAFLIGSVNPELICPHCQTKGCVHVKHVTQKKGISGGKATGAILTGGLSLLATGLSRKESCTAAFCENCKSSWVF